MVYSGSFNVKLWIMRILEFGIGRRFAGKFPACELWFENLQVVIR